MKFTINNKLLSKENSTYNSLDLTSPLKLPVIIGLNPFIDYTDYRIETLMASTPCLQITPLYPSAMGNSVSGALRIIEYSPQRGYEQYEKVLKDVGISLRDNERPLTVAFQLEGPINESFGNEYTESMFEQIGNTSVPFLSEISKLSGAKSLKSTADYMANYLKGSTSNTDASIPGAKKSFNDLLKNVLNMSGAAAGSTMNIVGNMLSYFDDILGETGRNLILGSNLDFPLNWGGSSYMPTYSVHVRLVNPFPGNDDYFVEYIYRPLAMLLALCIPMSTSNSTYSYPVSCHIDCPGLFRIKAGAVQNIEVIKGLDGNEISYEQRVNTIDLNITFIDLYSSIISNVEEDHENLQDPYRPTFKDYMNNILCKVEIPFKYSEKDYNPEKLKSNIYGQKGMLITPIYVMKEDGTVEISYKTSKSDLPQADIDNLNNANLEEFNNNSRSSREIYEVTKEIYDELNTRLLNNTTTDNLLINNNLPDLPNYENIFNQQQVNTDKIPTAADYSYNHIRNSLRNPNTPNMFLDFNG